jgi:threonine/homoserine/homoserine lactone efflux protein
MNTHKHLLREFAKFLSGLVAGDFIAGVWLISMKSNSFTALGVNFNMDMMIAWLLFDIVLFLLLVHYGWRANIVSPSISERSIYKIIGWVLGLVAVAHFLRIAFGVSIMIDAFSVPLWFSWIGFIVTAYLSYSSFHFSRAAKSKKGK